MPYITNESLCLFCKYLVEFEVTSKRKCQAFPNGIPIEIYATDMTYDHREPYEGDHGIQFEFLKDEDELRRRFPRYAKDNFFGIVLERYNETIEIIEMGRRGGYISPPYPSDDENRD